MEDRFNEQKRESEIYRAKYESVKEDVERELK